MLEALLTLVLADDIMSVVEDIIDIVTVDMSVMLEELAAKAVATRAERAKVIFILMIFCIRARQLLAQHSRGAA